MFYSSFVQRAVESHRGILMIQVTRPLHKKDRSFFMKHDKSLKITTFLEKTLLDLFEIEKPIKSKSKKIKRIAEEVRTLSDEYVFSNNKNRNIHCKK